MTYRAKLLIAFFSVVFCTSLLALGSYYWEISHIFINDLKSEILAPYIYPDLQKLKWLSLALFLITLGAGCIAAIFLSQFITRALLAVTHTVQNIGEGKLQTRLHIQSQDEFGELASAINSMAKRLEDHERLKRVFIRYVSEHVMEKILSSDLVTHLKGERRKVTVLYSDIRGFTKISEKLTAEGTVALLNEYLGQMIDLIFANNGTLDKFLGDGLQVEFGIPLDDPNQEKNALKTALEMQDAIQILNRKLLSEGRPVLQIGIGIHTGMAVVGNIGSEKWMEYTVVGESIYVASQVERATKQFNEPILVSETTVENLRGGYKVSRVGSFAIPGQGKTLDLYKVEK